MDNNTQTRPGIPTNRGGISPGSANAVKNDSPPVTSGVASQPIISATNGAASGSTNVNPAPPPPPTPIGGPKGKEREPLPTPFPDVVNMSETEVKNEEHEVERELEKIIEKSPQNKKPEVSDEVKAIGVELAGEDMDMPSIQIGPSKLPMGYEEAAQTRKQYRWKDSVAWLAAVIMYHWKRFNFVNKKK